MPIIPGVNTPEVKAAAANTPYFKIDTTAEAFGSGIGKSMQTLGESLGKVSNAIDTFAADQAKRQKEADTSNAVDVTTRFQGKMQDIEQSFYGLGGQPAATGMPAIAMQVNRLKQDALSGAQTPEAAQLALGAINGLATQSMERMARHADSQQTVYDNDLDQQRVNQSKVTIARNYNDDDAFVVNSHIADQSTQHIAIRGARSADGTITAAQAIAATDAARTKTMSEMITARIGGALDQHDLAYADKLRAKYGGELLPTDRAWVDQQYRAVQFQSRLGSETKRVSAVAQP